MGSRPGLAESARTPHAAPTNKAARWLPLMFMDLRSEANHLLYLYFNSIGVIQRDHGREDILEQVDAMCRDIRSCQNRIHEMLDKLCETRTEQTACETLDSSLRDGLEFVDWIVGRGLGAQGIQETPKANMD